MLVFCLYVLCPTLLFPTLNYFIILTNFVDLHGKYFLCLKQVHYRIRNILLGFFCLKDLERELYYVSAILAHNALLS